MPYKNREDTNTKRQDELDKLGGLIQIFLRGDPVFCVLAVEFGFFAGLVGVLKFAAGLFKVFVPAVFIWIGGQG